MNRTRQLLSGFLLLLCFVCGTFTAFSQGTNLGTIRGTVKDPNGAVVPGANVQVNDLATNISRDLTTDQDGNYEAPNLKPGSYRVTVTNQGFKTFVANVNLSGSETIRADANFEVGDTNATVEVTSESSGVIQTETPTIQNTITSRQFQEVPRDSREVLDFLYLNPDITQGAGGSGSFKFIGAQSYGANISLDGQRTNGGIFGEATSSQPSLETIGELTVLSKNFTAEYSGIANIRIETKRGGKDFHGSLFYNNKNSALAARSIQDKIAEANFTPSAALSSFPTPYFNLNETGGSLTGPVPFSQKTFFLLSYERRWDFAPLQIRASNIPTSVIFGGDFTAINAGNRPKVPDSLCAAPDVVSNSFADPKVSGTCKRRFNVIPTGLLNPIAQNILKNYYPQSSPSAPFNPVNGRLRDFVQNFGGLLTRDLATTRIDHDFSDKNKFYAVYNFQTRSGIRSLVASPLPAFGLLSQHQKNHTLSLSDTHIFSSRVVNELRGGFNYQFLYRRANQTTGQFLSNIGFNADEIKTYGSIVGPSLVDTPGQVAFTIGPFAGIASGSRNVNRPLDQKLLTFGDTLTWTTGKHSLKFGADFVRNQAVDGFAFNRNNPRGTISYGNSNLDSFARFLIGLSPTSATFVSKVRPALEVSNWETGYFVQDDFRIHPRVTLNLGLRYELITPFVDKNDLLINFDPNGKGNNGSKGRFIIPDARIIPQINQFFIDYGVATAKEVGVGRGLVKTDRNNFAPRLGIAWRISDKNVLRGGYGIFYPTSAAQGMRDAFASNAFNQRVTLNSTTAAPLAGLPGGINPRGITPFNGGAKPRVQGVSINAIPFDLQNPRYEQFNATFERELWWNTGVRVSYVGVRSHGLISGFDLNELPPSNVPFGITNEEGGPCDPLEGDCTESPADDARRPFTGGLGDFLASFGNRGKGKSNAFQAELNRRFSTGINFGINYTLLDQKASVPDLGNSSLGGALYNQFDPEQDFARDTFVSRHRLVTYGAYQLPYGRGQQYKPSNGVLDAVAGGWQVSWNMFAKSGTGFTPFWTCNNCSPVFPGNIASGFADAVGDFNGPSFRPVVVGDPYAGSSNDQFFNPNAFGLPPTGADVFSNPNVAKRNFLVGPGTWGVNLGLRKYFSFNENVKLEVGADFDNVFNHPLLSPPGATGDTSEAAGSFANLGDFDISLDSKGQPVILPGNVNRNPNFGVNNLSYQQEGIDNRRSIRIRLRLTF